MMILDVLGFIKAMANYINNLDKGSI